MIPLDRAKFARALAARGLSAAEFARRAGCSTWAVDNALAGRPVRYQTLRKFFAALDVIPPLPGSDSILPADERAQVPA